jgi:hypothetical protein
VADIEVNLDKKCKRCGEGWCYPEWVLHGLYSKNDYRGDPKYPWCNSFKKEEIGNMAEQEQESKQPSKEAQAIMAFVASLDLLVQQAIEAKKKFENVMKELEGKTDEHEH